ncbi:SIMPL domain-containing protein [Shimia sp. CNT1-13L.2]|uniref:SIMPL domain-containing protein n=1 Tax=Shimia sp. CNT1-13L.2 TaxID=2959663 RepID=UPI0020CC164A|nr:SIMPL domain-containing protein [Shimia sp. CNT1-13L.2]MCP9481369.1 SIMPL domain-containing protein [Shimia sp. CNT1-13L.2]
MRVMSMILGLAVVLASVAGSPALAEGRQITVQGQGSVEAVPDMAVLTMGVSRQADTAGDAMALVAGAAQEMLARLEAMGVEARDMQTSELSLHPVWERDRYENRAPKVIGFNASTQVTVKLRDLARVGQVLDAVVQDGANQFNGLRFSLQDPDPQMNEARVAAVADARARAELYAKAAGVTLGPVLSIQEHGGAAPAPVFMARAAMAEAAMPIAEGEVSVQAGVTMVFAIAD